MRTVNQSYVFFLDFDKKSGKKVVKDKLVTIHSSDTNKQFTIFKNMSFVNCQFEDISSYVGFEFCKFDDCIFDSGVDDMYLSFCELC